VTAERADGRRTEAKEQGMSSKKLMRSRDDKMLFGVAAGIAHYFGIDPSIVRLVWVVAILLPGPNIIIVALYALMAFIMPLDSTGS
jgi:phage shock protein C